MRYAILSGRAAAAASGLRSDFCFGRPGAGCSSLFALNQAQVKIARPLLRYNRPQRREAVSVSTMEWLYPLSGFVVGAVVGLTGMGGGSLMTPLLILLFGVHPLTAVGTDLLYAAVTKTAGTAIHSRRGNVDWSVAALLSAGSIPATVLTIWVLSLMPRENPATADIISISTGVALVIAAVAIFFRRRIRNYALARAEDPARTQYSGPITIVLGALLGSLVSFCSVGAGALGVAVLFFLYPRLPPARVVGSDLAHAVPLTLIAGLGHWLIGDVDWHILGLLLLGSLPGIIAGSHLAAQIADRILLPILASILTLIGLRLIAW